MNMSVLSSRKENKEKESQEEFTDAERDWVG
jgi:hypothetical protein